MSPLAYHRPKSLAEAISLLPQGLPLGGGTRIAPLRRGISAVIDLQDLGLDGLKLGEDSIQAGAALKLQAIVEAGDRMPAVLAEACRREAGANLRNMATLGGSIVSADGRSPLVTTLLAMDTRAMLEPGAEEISLDELLDRRGKGLAGRLVIGLRIGLPASLGYEQVGRSPADRPIVCAAVARMRGKRPMYRVAIGGFGPRPTTVPAGKGDPEQAAEAARKAFAGAGDAWASAEYRSSVAGTLVLRLLKEAAV